MGNNKLAEFSQILKHTELDQKSVRTREKEFEEFYFIAVVRSICITAEYC